MSIPFSKVAAYDTPSVLNINYLTCNVSGDLSGYLGAALCLEKRGFAL